MNYEIDSSYNVYQYRSV